MRVGIVGGGQLAMMMAEAGDRIGLEVSALTGQADDPVAGRVAHLVIGDARNAEDLRQLAKVSDVVTFDHELVDVSTISELENEGIVFRPGPKTLAYATNKQRQWELYDELGFAQPETIIVNDVEAALDAIARFGGTAVLKTATGGYDGRGVLLGATTAAESSVREWYPSDSVVLVQRNIDIDHELAAQVVRGSDGVMMSYAPVCTVQSNGMCSVVHVPAQIDSELEAQAAAIARKIADAIDVVGILAVEFFVSEGQLVVNELAARPHNSGHLTIEASTTSQFENHMRAVAGLPLGAPDTCVPAAAMVNLVGQIASTEPPSSLSASVSVHRYGKTPRPGRKLGHVTAVADSVDKAVASALHAATELQIGDEKS